MTRDRDTTSVEVCAFDMFGTLFDVHSVVAACRDAFGDEGEDFDARWRRKQLQYSWLRVLMGRYVPFSRDALDAALSVFDRSDDDELREGLMAPYGEVSPYPDARQALRGLQEAGVRRVILTNGSRDIVSSTLAAAAFEGLFERVFSVEDVETFKPHPGVHRMAYRALGLEPEPPPIPGTWPGPSPSASRAPGSTDPEASTTWRIWATTRTTWSMG